MSTMTQKTAKCPCGDYGCLVGVQVNPDRVPHEVYFCNHCGGRFLKELAAPQWGTSHRHAAKGVC